METEDVFEATVTIEDLPAELLSSIMLWLSVKNVCQCRLVSHRWNELASGCIKALHTTDDTERVQNNLRVYMKLEKLSVDGIGSYRADDLQQSHSSRPHFHLVTSSDTHAWLCCLRELGFIYLHAHEHLLQSVEHICYLERLSIRSVRGLSQNSFGWLRGCTNLTTLELERTNVTDETLSLLASEGSSLTHTLKDMTLAVLSDVTDDGVCALVSNCNALERLHLEQLPNVSDQVMTSVASNVTLRRLSLSGMHIGDNGIDRLVEEETLLTELILQSTHALSPVGVLRCTNIKSLRDLTLSYLPKIKYANIMPIFSNPLLDVHVFGMRMP